MPAWRALAFCAVCLCSLVQGAGLNAIHSQRLNREVPVSFHMASKAVVARWAATHPRQPMRLVLFLPGAFDGPGEFMQESLDGFLTDQEVKGSIPPSLWVAVAHFRGWYADRADGTFPYERFLMDELIPLLEAQHPGFGGRPSARSVAGLSMGGFGALNLAARTGAFSKCLALSPALVEPPFLQVNWFLRRSLKRAFTMDPAHFAPWNPWKHLGGSADLVIGCGTEDRYGLAETCRTFARICRERNRPLRLELSPGGHDWSYWAPAFRKWTPWLVSEN